MAAVRVGLVISVALFVLAGCSPATPPTPSATPSPTCTPEAGGDPYPCTPYEHDQMLAKDALYTEAEQVYRKYLAEDERIYRAGGVDQATPVIMQTTTGEYRTRIVQMYQALKTAHATATGGAYTLAWVQRVPGASRQGSIVAIEACIDTSSVTMGAQGAKPAPGLISEQTAYFAFDGTELKLTSADVVKVTKC